MTVLDSAAAAHQSTAPTRRSRIDAGPERIVAAGVAVAAAVVLLQITANLVDFGVYDYGYAWLDPNNENGLFAWIGGVVAAAGACMLLLRSRRDGAERTRYLVAGVLLAIVVIENRVRFKEHTVHGPAIYVPLLGSLFAALVWASWSWPRVARSTLWAGLASLVLSLLLHKIAPHVLAHYGYGPGDWPYEVKVSLKESSELCGWILIATSLVASRRTS